MNLRWHDELWVAVFQFNNLLKGVLELKKNCIGVSNVPYQNVSLDLPSDEDYLSGQSSDDSSLNLHVSAHYHHRANGGNRPIGMQLVSYSWVNLRAWLWDVFGQISGHFYFELRLICHIKSQRTISSWQRCSKSAFLMSFFPPQGAPGGAAGGLFSKPGSLPWTETPQQGGGVGTQNREKIGGQENHSIGQLWLSRVRRLIGVMIPVCRRLNLNSKRKPTRFASRNVNT